MRRFADDGGIPNSLWSPAGWDYRSAHSLICPHYWNEALFKPNHPVVGISWFEAEAYCQWLTSRMHTRDQLMPEEVIRLPTEVEWEIAAGWDPATRRILTWPWGDTFDSNRANTSETRVGGTSPVGAFLHGMSSIGAFDMAGNVWEWTSSQPKDSPYEATDCYEDATINTPKVLRGGDVSYNKRYGTMQLPRSPYANMWTKHRFSLCCSQPAFLIFSFELMHSGEAVWPKVRSAFIKSVMLK